MTFRLWRCFDIAADAMYRPIMLRPKMDFTLKTNRKKVKEKLRKVFETLNFISCTLSSKP